MKKIASPDELASELRSLLAYAEGDQPSRERLASELSSLAGRVGGSGNLLRLLDNPGTSLSDLYQGARHSFYGEVVERIAKELSRTTGGPFKAETDRGDFRVRGGGGDFWMVFTDGGRDLIMKHDSTRETAKVSISRPEDTGIDWIVEEAVEKFTPFIRFRQR